ncbi:ankyrin repeat protein, partial [Gregarina niphandrodes]
MAPEGASVSNKPRLVSFSAFRGFDPSDLMERYVRQVMTLIHAQTRSDGIVLDLSHCVLIKDSHLVHLLAEDSPFVPSPKVTASRTKLVGVKLDFCNLITDKGLTALLTAHLPHIRLLSLRCVRSEKFTGAPFAQALSPDLWPKLKCALVDFSSITLEACNAVVEMLASRRLESTSPVSQEDVSKGPPWFSFLGSQASKSYMESIGARHLVARLNQALNSGNPSDLRSLKDAADTESLMTDYGPLAEYVSGRGGQYIMNLPVTSCTSEEGGVNVWTLPISLALLNGDPAFVEALVECGAEVDIVDHLGKSPLYRAVSSGNVEVCKYLLEHGVDITPLNITLPTPMNAAVMTKNITITRMLIEYGYPFNLRCPGFKAFKSPLHVAAELPNERLIHDLLDWGADPNLDQNTGNTALHYAAEGGQLECAKLMLRYGCEVDVQNYAMQSPLHLACHENELEIVEYLLCTGSDFLDLADANNETPLVTAIQTRNDRVALRII